MYLPSCLEWLSYHIRRVRGAQSGMQGAHGHLKRNLCGQLLEDLLFTFLVPFNMWVLLSIVIMEMNGKGKLLQKSFKYIFLCTRMLNMHM